MNDVSSTASYETLSRMIDHAVLKPTSTTEELSEGCRVAVRYRAASICLLPYFVPDAARLLSELDEGRHGVVLSTVIGFPHGCHATSAKLAEVEAAAREGARELDMVVNQSLVKSHQWRSVTEDIRAVVEACRARACLVKVIFETAELGGEEIRELCGICNEIGPDWIKTSTGFASGGATLDAVTLMRRHATPRIEIKASGGIRDLETALEYRAAGATRLGTSSTSAILDEWSRRC